MRKLLRLNAVLNLANALKTLLQDLLLCDLINVLARFEKYSLILRRYSTPKVPNLFLIDTIYMPVVIYIS